jgi:hypothetical protein
MDLVDVGGDAWFARRGLAFAVRTALVVGIGPRHPAPLRDTAWARLGDSGVGPRMPFALRAELAGIYGDLRALENTFRTLITGLSQPRADRDTAAYQRDFIRVIAMAIMVATENRLLRQYSEIEPKLRALVD